MADIALLLEPEEPLLRSPQGPDDGISSGRRNHTQTAWGEIRVKAQPTIMMPPGGGDHARLAKAMS
jgi:hypothetical protein